MLYKNKKEIYDIIWQNKHIIRVKYGLYLVWERIMSCFGKGYWINNNIWIDRDLWKNWNT